MSPLRVLVCGSNYGRAYVAALARDPRKYQLAGILAQGSLRSHEVAALNGVPLYLSTEELPGNIDLACAAMASSAMPVVLQIIRRGVHILCEHPYPPVPLKQAMDLAYKRNLQFHVNGHFARLPAPSAFVKACRRFGKLQRPQFVDIMTTERALYATLDILISAVRDSQPLRTSVLSRGKKFVLLEGKLGKTPFRLSVQVSGKQGGGQLTDGSPGYLLDQRLTIAFAAGVLTMLSTAGPILWHRNPTLGTNSGEPLWTVLSGQAPQTAADLQEQRILANVQALNAIRGAIQGSVPPEEQQSRHILEVSKAWELVGRQLRNR